MYSEKVMKLIFRKDAFITAADLVNIMRECSYEMNDTNKSILDSLAFVYDGLELPVDMEMQLH